MATGVSAEAEDSVGGERKMEPIKDRRQTERELVQERGCLRSWAVDRNNAWRFLQVALTFPEVTWKLTQAKLKRVLSSFLIFSKKYQLCSPGLKGCGLPAYALPVLLLCECCRARAQAGPSSRLLTSVIRILDDASFFCLWFRPWKTFSPLSYQTFSFYFYYDC